jgi:hypothetical protein
MIFDELWLAAHTVKPFKKSVTHSKTQSTQPIRIERTRSITHPRPYTWRSCPLPQYRDLIHIPNPPPCHTLCRHPDTRIANQNLKAREECVKKSTQSSDTETDMPHSELVPFSCGDIVGGNNVGSEQKGTNYTYGMLSRYLSALRFKTGCALGVDKVETFKL